ncbi:ubiquinone biosynthesis protein COQ9 [Histoplasma capsulatum G186AR]|uniref:Ubiquinone biosynthesis protein n=1 Tax=Ajellomyces capsulatus (strain G186AR / H82 / ATCC MYA-2454 / RMSCC 2432) TaxID=447093 RepID=C0NH21_AJECG|nr:ubiquinone biosynthesis protein COQ9 [Histoplasma capsulatum G186AR]EEH09106.1 ubiquinone biosynthesis protein COQ9 [Histoplasma capsulatum G186AR]
MRKWGDAEAQKFAKNPGALNLRAESDNELRAHLQLNGYLVQVLNHEPPADTYTPEQSAILSAAVNHIPEVGFTTRSLTLGARDAGYLDVSLQLFPDGGEMNLITYWLRSRRGMLRQKTKSGELFGMSGAGEIGGLSVEEKVLILILERLKMNEEIIEHWQDALATMSLPFNLAPSISELSALSSDILYLANDHSVDSSWYTKRLSVATVYASADVFMTEDTSPGFSATKEFVERQLSDVNLVTRTLSDAKRYLGIRALFGASQQELSFLLLCTRTAGFNKGSQDRYWGLLYTSFTEGRNNQGGER